MESTLLSPPEGFSNRCWSDDSFDDDCAYSYIEMDPRSPPSKRFIHVSSDSWFSFPLSGHINPDRMLPDGPIIPHFFEDKEADHPDALNHFISFPSSTAPLLSQVCCVSMKRIWRFSIRIMHRFMMNMNCASMTVIQDKKRYRNAAPEVSGIRCEAAVSDSESSINEAVLHCKRTGSSMISMY